MNALPADRSFYQRWFMARNTIDPAAHGVPLSTEEFKIKMDDALTTYGQGKLSLDELILRPRQAIHFCEGVRMANGWFDLPDDIILRAIMQYRKNG